MIFSEVRFDVPQKKEKQLELEHILSDPALWADPTKAQAISRQKAAIDQTLLQFGVLESSLGDAQALFDLAFEVQDQAVLEEVVQILTPLAAKLSDFELKLLLADDLDQKNAFVTLNAGSGGTESQDWALMLLRMYQRFCTDQGWTVELLDYQDGEQAGIKSATLLVSGQYAFGFLKAEAGVHRLVRISPFDANARRHTSFASAFVTAEVDENIEIIINPADLRIDVYRSGGKGGQGVNTTDSAVRITHFPSGLVVVCQQERSQIKNKDRAMKVLRSRLYEQQLEKERQKQAAIENAKQENTWGSQIRSYVLHPYKLVKDHRTGFSSPTAEKVLDGDLQGFIQAYLKCKATGQWHRSLEGSED